MTRFSRLQDRSFRRAGVPVTSTFDRARACLVRSQQIRRSFLSR